MASSAFKSATKRASIGGSSSEDSSIRSLRRSRSVSRFSHPIAPEQETETDYNKIVPRGKFVNTTRGSSMAFPEISLDDLALELFSSSSKNDNESDGVVVERKEREGRLVSRRGEIGRWASDTASSRRRGRSVSRTRGGDVVSCSSTSGAKKVISSDGGSRRRSLSVAKFQISDSEGNERKTFPPNFPSNLEGNGEKVSEVDRARNLSNRATVKASFNGNSHMPSAQKTVSSTRRLGRSRSHNEFSQLHDGYSSHSSGPTDEESKVTHVGKNGHEKIIRAVYAQKAEHPTEDVANGGLYEAMRKELRYAVEELRTELNQVMGRNQKTLASGDCLRSHHDFSRTREKYATKLEQLEQHKQDLLAEMLLEEQRVQEVTKMVKELPYSRPSAVTQKPSRTRKKSSDRSRVSKNLVEEAERYFEDFICNVEDTDISSFDGERSEGSSALLEKTSERAETCKTHAGFTSQPVEMDGVILPWLQWETSHDDYLPGMNEAMLTPVIPEALWRDPKKDVVSLNDPSSHSISSGGSWSPGLFDSPPIIKGEDSCKTRQHNSGSPSFDMDEYLKLRNNEELLFEMYREKHRITSGGLLLCTTGGFY
ncbi:hypothetical protein OROGR_031172 [Orobanche gracilis]